MSQMSDYLEVELIKHIFRTGSFTKPTVLGIALATGAPTDASTGATITEVTNANSYARVDTPPLDANWAATSGTNGLTSNVADISFAAASGSWGTVTHVAIIDSVTHGAGNMLFYGTLTASKAVGSGDTFKFGAGNLSITLA
jgi:hypothetical protein